MYSKYEEWCVSLFGHPFVLLIVIIMPPEYLTGRGKRELN